MEYLLTADAGHEVVFTVDGPLAVDLTAIALAYAHMAKQGLKVGYLFEIDSERWFVRLELP